MINQEQNLNSGENLTSEQAEREIEMIWHQIAQFGAVSNERDLIEDIKRRLKSNEITAEVAVAEAHQILHGKNGFETHYR